jgi:hypothetical protein
MRFPLPLLMLVPALSCSCSLQPQRSEPGPGVEPPRPAAPPVVAPPAPAIPAVAVQSGPVSSPQATEKQFLVKCDFRFGGIAFEGIAFDARTHALRVVDQPGGPGSIHGDAAAAGASMGALAAVNGGFFTPEGAPLGLVISGGRPAGAWNGASSVCGALWHEDVAGIPALSRRSELGRAQAARMRELLQAGPMLVDAGTAVGGLENERVRVRTVLLWDGGWRWWIGISSPCGLADLAKVLAQARPAGWRVRRAMNLDGGRSSELWVSSAVAGAELLRRPMWNRPVRNFLVLVARHP